MTHLIFSLKKLGKIFKLQKELLKTEMNHDEIDKNNWRDKKTNGLIMLKTTFYVLLFLMRGFLKQWKILPDFQ